VLYQGMTDLNKHWKLPIGPKPDQPQFDAKQRLDIVMRAEYVKSRRLCIKATLSPVR
jgi:hypothetical protein